MTRWQQFPCFTMMCVYFEQGDLFIETDSSLLSGFTYWKKKSDGRHRVAMKVNKEKFFEHLFEVF